MGRQNRTPRMGRQEIRHDLIVGSSTKATIPNYGLTVITTNMGTDFTLEQPEMGVEKILHMAQATTGVFVRACPKGTSAAAFTSTATDTIIEFDAAGDKTVTLVGLSTSRWLITAIVPVSTAIVVGGS